MQAGRGSSPHEIEHAWPRFNKLQPDTGQKGDPVYRLRERATLARKG